MTEGARTMRMWSWRRPSILAVGLAALSGGCGITVQRDLSATKPGEVVFDDLCGLQGYFDSLHDSTIAPPREVFGSDLTGSEATRATGGKTRYRFETDFQMQHLRKVLSENWGSLPDEVAKAPALDLEVQWAEKASVKRVITTEPAVLGVGDKNFELPYHVCLSDLLFGESLYKTRRMVLQLPPPPKSPFSKRGASVTTNGALGVHTLAGATTSATSASPAPVVPTTTPAATPTTPAPVPPSPAATPTESAPTPPNAGPSAPTTGATTAP